MGMGRAGLRPGLLLRDDLRLPAPRPARAGPVSGSSTSGAGPGTRPPSCATGGRRGRSRLRRRHGRPGARGAPRHDVRPRGRPAPRRARARWPSPSTPSCPTPPCTGCPTSRPSSTGSAPSSAPAAGSSRSRAAPATSPALWAASAAAFDDVGLPEPAHPWTFPTTGGAGEPARGRRLPGRPRPALRPTDAPRARRDRGHLGRDVRPGRPGRAAHRRCCAPSVLARIDQHAEAGGPPRRRRLVGRLRPAPLRRRARLTARVDDSAGLAGLRLRRGGSASVSACVPQWMSSATL